MQDGEVMTMAKIHDKYVIELAEVIKVCGNIRSYRASEFYRFYELPNIAVSRENFEKMKPLEEATLYGYPLEELIMFARACIACGITAEDMKQFATNHDFIVKALKKKWEEVMDDCTKQR